MAKAPTALVSGIKASPKEPGSFVLQITKAGKRESAVIPVSLVPRIHTSLQRSLAEKAFAQKKQGMLTTGLSLPHLTIEESSTAKKGRKTDLCSRTVETGWMVWKASDDALRDLKRQIDEVLVQRVSSSRVN